MTNVIRIRARHARARVIRQYGMHRIDTTIPNDGMTHVRVAPETFALGIGRMTYPPAPSLYVTGEYVVPAYPWGMPDVPRS